MGRLRTRHVPKKGTGEYHPAALEGAPLAGRHRDRGGRGGRSRTRTPPLAGVRGTGRQRLAGGGGVLPAGAREEWRPLVDAFPPCSLHPKPPRRGQGVSEKEAWDPSNGSL